MFMCVYVYVCMSVCVYVCMCVWVYVCVCVCVNVCVCDGVLMRQRERGERTLDLVFLIYSNTVYYHLGFSIFVLSLTNKILETIKARSPLSFTL